MAKMTKKEMFAAIRANLTDADEIAFIDHEIELLSNKSASPAKPTKTQLANIGIKDNIAEVLADGAMTATEVAKACGLDSNQKASALLRQMVAEGRVVKGLNGKITVFSLAD